VVTADGGAGAHEVAHGSFSAVVDQEARGPVRVDPASPQRFIRDDGSAFFVLGENRINVYDPTWNYRNMGTDAYIAAMARHGMTTLRIFTFADAESEQVPGGAQPGALEPAIGRFDPHVAQQLDEVMNAAERHDVQVIFTVYAIGFTGGAETWRSWNDNPYSTTRGGPVKEPIEFFTSPAVRSHHLRKVQYVLDRWGYSTHLLAIDLLNEPEWDGEIPETVWVPWAQWLAKETRARDPYGHLVTAGPVGLKWNIEGDERPWYATPDNAMVQWHLYGKEFYEPHALAAEMTRKVEETWSFGKPVFCGEFAYGGEDKTTYDHTHAGIWSAIMSGGGALAHTAPPFEIDSDEPMTDERGHHFRVLADFLHTFDRAPALSPASDVGVSLEGARAWSLRSADGRHRALWLLAGLERYEAAHDDVKLTIPLPAGKYGVQWWNDVTGEHGQPVTLDVTEGAPTKLAVPGFTRHVAAAITPPPAPAP
jgi:hypothetical protein